MLPTWFKEYLSFHRSERRAIIVLVIALFALIAFNMYQRFFWKGDWQEIQLAYGKQIIQFQQRSQTKNANEESTQPWLPKKNTHFQFNPNTLDSIGWVKLGFSPKQAASIIKYRTAGAEFRKPEDIKKLFVVDDEKYEELKPFIQIEPLPEKPSPKETYKKKEYTKPKWENPAYAPKNIELNTTDSATLVQVRGIGPFFARVIIEHRDKLGGYRTKDQVLEVYGMDSAKFAIIQSELWVDSSAITKININKATLKELLRHPYINFNQAKAIVNYREQHGLFSSVAQLQKIHLVRGAPYLKVATYLTTE